MQALLIIGIWLSFMSHSAAGVSATLGNGEITCTSSAAVLGVRSGTNDAVFTIGDKTIVVDQKQVSAGQKQSIALPANWKHVELTDSAKGIEIEADGKAVGVITPAR